MERTDQTLLTAYLEGAEEAFRQLLHRHIGFVYGVAIRHTRNDVLAEEVSQDVFLILARKARQLTQHPSVAGWLHRTAVHVAKTGDAEDTEP